MRIAVCYSGQVRTWETCLRQNMAFYQAATNVEVDYFYHTWDETEVNQSLAQKYKSPTASVSDTELTIINEILKPKRCSVTPVQKGGVFSNRWMNLLYSLSASLLCMQEYSNENNISYDIVIKSRFDVLHNPERALLHALNVFHSNPHALLTAHCMPMECEFFTPNFNDIVFYGTQASMDIVSNIYYDRYTHFDRLYSGQVNETIREFDYHAGPGTTIYKYATDKNVRIYDDLNIREVIVRENSDVDPTTIEGYKYYVRKHEEWYHR